MEIIDSRDRKKFIVSSGDVIVTNDDKYLVASSKNRGLDLIYMDTIYLEAIIMTDPNENYDSDGIISFIENELVETIVDVIPKSRVKLVIK